MDKYCEIRMLIGPIDVGPWLGWTLKQQMRLIAEN